MTAPPLARLLLLAAALSLGPRAAAQPYSDPGPGVGVFGASGWWSGQGSASPSAGVFGSTRLTGALGLEVSAAFFRTTYAKDGVDALRVTGLPVSVAGFLFFFHERRVQPYVVLGVGLLWLRSRGEGEAAGISDSELLLAVQGGAGVQARVARRVTAHLDVRFSSTDSQTVSDVIGSRVEAVTVRLGAAWHF